MREKGNIYIHFIEESADHVLCKRLVSSVPRTGDEMRFGGEGSEKYYKITRVVWVYDEPTNPFERVNIGVELDI